MHHVARLQLIGVPRTPRSGIEAQAAQLAGRGVHLHFAAAARRPRIEPGRRANTAVSLRGRYGF